MPFIPMIIGEIRRHLRDSGAIKVSRSLKDIAYKALTAKEMLTGKFYNERRVKGYNHLTGWLDDWRPGKCNELAMEPYKVNNLIIVE